MEDRDFIDLMYQGWSKTTGAESMFWMPEEDKDFPGTYTVYAVKQGEEDMERMPLMSFCSEADAAFITAIHGSFADLCRRLHAALDEADRLDTERDEREHEMMQLAVENEELRERVSQLEECW